MRKQRFFQIRVSPPMWIQIKILVTLDLTFTDEHTGLSVANSAIILEPIRHSSSFVGRVNTPRSFISCSNLPNRTRLPRSLMSKLQSLCKNTPNQTKEKETNLQQRVNSVCHTRVACRGKLN